VPWFADWPPLRARLEEGITPGLEGGYRPGLGEGMPGDEEAGTKMALSGDVEPVSLELLALLLAFNASSISCCGISSGHSSTVD
jgi:hypothetical protein